MRILITLLMLTLCSACTLKPSEIKAPSLNNAQAVVFDIDGTLTPNIPSIRTVRPDAAKAVQIYADKGYNIFYISARKRLLQGFIPAWLHENEFPCGSIIVPEKSEDDAKFKTRILEQLTKVGWKIDYAYGDSTTDFVSYSAVNIPKEHVFALRRDGYIYGEKDCDKGIWEACLKDGWTPHLDYINNTVKSVKPVVAQ